MRLSVDRLTKEHREPPRKLQLTQGCCEGYPLKLLLKDLGDWELAEVKGAEGCSVVLAREEIETGDVWLVKEAPWRLVILGDKYHRRWCRRVYQIILDEGEGI